MFIIKKTVLFFKQNILYLLPFFIIPGILSLTIYNQDIRTFHAVMQNNEKQVLEFHEKLIFEHLKSLEEDISYLKSHFRSFEYVNSGFDSKYDLTQIYGSFLRRKDIYSSVRIIDSSGFERFRMDYDGNTVTKIPENKLQSKGHRYYFNEIMNKDSGEIYFSKLDFNYEAGKIQFPYEPVLRVAEIIIDQEGNKKAFVILNYRGADIINLIDQNSVYSFGKSFMENNEGTIISMDASLSEEKLKVIDFLGTDEGKLFLKPQEGQINISSGFLTYKRINISRKKISPDWTLISFVDGAKIAKNTKSSYKRGLTIFIILSFLSLIAASLAYKNRKNRIQANKTIEDRARIFDLNPAPVIKTSNSGEILSSNIAAKKILGFKLPFPTIYEVFKKLNKDQLTDLTLGKNNYFEYEIGEKIYFITYIKEKISGHIFFYGTDITENYKIREDLKNFQTAVKQSANVIVFTDLEGRVLFANDAFEVVTGYSSNEVLGEKPAVLNSGYHSNSFYDELWGTIKSGKVWAGEFYNKRKDGSFFWEKATISPVLDKEGIPRFFIAVKEVITEKKEIEEELKQQTQNAENARIFADKAREEAESANLLKSTFLANMSHEIRTPMNAILGFTRLLLDKEIHKQDREMLDIIMNSGKNLLSLINDILDFSKIEANEIEISEVKINLTYFFEDLEDLFKIQTIQKNLGFILTLSDNLPKIVFGDENRIRQILINVIGNAIKFTESGSISIKVEWISNNMYISVSDTGIGIDKNKLEEIFSPFKQSDSSTDRKYEGTGLGLAISLRLVEMMNGTLQVESQLYEGSVFTISLPLKPGTELENAYNSNIPELDIRNKDSSIVESWLNKVKNDQILFSIVKDAITALPRHLDRLETVIISKNRDQIQAISHELMGSTGNLGMTEIHELLKDLNAGFKNNSTNDKEIDRIFKKMKNIIEGIPIEYLQEHASELLPVEGDSIDINILTADDSSVNRLLIEAMLSSIYVKSDFVKDGIEVLEKLEKGKYDILLLDIQMPKMDGIETIKRIREIDSYKDLYVIAVTANAMKGDDKKYLDMGCNDYISKPIQKDIFLKKIEHQIQQSNSYSNQTDNLPDSQETNNIITSLEQEMKIFKPERVKKIGTDLKKYISNKKISFIIDSLNEAADSFDSQGLKKIIIMLMELNENGNK